MTLDIVSEARAFGGLQRTYKHASEATGTSMRFAAFWPPAAKRGKVPVFWFLAGLTCTEDNFTQKAGAQRVAAELGVALIAPDTSPRGTDAQGERVPNVPEYDFGQGAGFYLDATEPPWSKHFRMRRYIEDELPGLLDAEMPVDMGRQGLSGHSMGGHGALTIGLRNPGRFRSVSAFAPIVSPMTCPWGEKALTGYLGGDRAKWRPYDACALIEDGARLPEILVDQGTADEFLATQLKPERLEAACRQAEIPLTLNRREGYDHSYSFISTFIESHLRWHAARMG